MKKNKPKMFAQNSLRKLNESLKELEATIEWKHRDDVDHTMESVFVDLIKKEIQHRTGNYDPPF